MPRRLALIVFLVATAIVVAGTSTFDILAGARMIIREEMLAERIETVLGDETASPERFRGAALYYDGEVGLRMLERCPSRDDPAHELQDRVVELEILLGMIRDRGTANEERLRRALARCRELDPQNAYFLLVDAARRLERGLAIAPVEGHPELVSLEVLDQAERDEGLRLLELAAELPRCQSYRVRGREQITRLLESAGMSRFVALYTAYSRLHHYSTLLVFGIIYYVDAITATAAARGETHGARALLETTITLFGRARDQAHTLLARRVFGNALKQLEHERLRIDPAAPAMVDVPAIELEGQRLILYGKEHDPFQLRAASNQPFLRLLLAFGVLLIDILIAGMVAIVTTVAAATLAHQRRKAAAAAAVVAAAAAADGAGAPPPDGAPTVETPSEAAEDPSWLISAPSAAVLGALAVGLLTPSALVAWQDATEPGFDITPFLAHVRWRLLPVLGATAVFAAVVAWRTCGPRTRDEAFARFLSDATSVALLGLTAACFIGVGLPLARERAALEQRLLGAMEDEAGYALDRIRAVEAEGPPLGPAGLDLGPRDAGRDAGLPPGPPEPEPEPRHEPGHGEGESGRRER